MWDRHGLQGELGGARRIDEKGVDKGYGDWSEIG